MSTSVNMTDVLVNQSLQSAMSSVISHFLTFIVAFLSVVLLHDTFIRSKQLHTSWWSQMLASLGRDHPASPPGPWWNLPLLGFLPWLGSKPYQVMWNLCRRYGSVFQIRMGSRDVVVLNGLKTIREAFVQQGDTFAGRPNFSSFAPFCEGRSLAFNSLDADWITQRKVAVRVLGMFACNTNYPIEDLIRRHAVALADGLIRDSAPIRDGPELAAVDPYDAVESALVDVLFEVCYGTAGDGDKELYSEMMAMLHEMREVMPTVQSADMMPWTAPLLRRPLQRYATGLQRVHQLSTEKIDSLVRAGVPELPLCVVHALHHACEAEIASDDADGSQRARIMAVVQDFIGAGSEVTVHFIHWAILYSAKYPRVQERVHDEIRRTIGLMSAPTGSDRARMPYTQACILEIMRHSCLSALSIPHMTLGDTVIGGCSVPANTVVIANYYSIGWDTDVWGDPGAFRPERFMTSDGSRLDRQVVSQFMSFGAGHRRCPGGKFSTLEMFLFFVVLMQRCTFSAPPGQQLSTDDGTFVLTNQAKRYGVLVQAAANDEHGDAN